MPKAKKRILFVNGILNTAHSLSFTDKLIPYFLEFRCIDIVYPWWGALMAMRPKEVQERAEILASKAKPGDHIIAHSAGCLLTLEAMKLGASFDKVFMFGAAIPQKAQFPESGMSSLWNIHSPDDKALTWALFHPHFGWMGKYGYKGKDKRVFNIKAGSGHNGYVQNGEAEAWASYIKARLV